MLKGYRTVILNVLVAIAGLTQGTGLMTLIPEQYVPYAMLAAGIANVILRFDTTTGIFKSA